MHREKYTNCVHLVQSSIKNETVMQIEKQNVSASAPEASLVPSQGIYHLNSLHQDEFCLALNFI